MAAGPELLLAPSAVPLAIKKLSSDIAVVFLDGIDTALQVPGQRPNPPGDQMLRQLYQNNMLADAVTKARSEGRFPVCFSGGCNSSIGVVGGIDDQTRYVLV